MRNGLGQKPVEDDAPGNWEALQNEITRVLAEESPRLEPRAAARQLEALRRRTAEKRAGRRRPGWPSPWALPRWAMIAATVVVVVLLANGITVASASSVPGSPLYSVKRLAEQGTVILSPSSGDRARLWMDLASRRLDEAQYLLTHEQRVDGSILDAIDESILRALGEIAGTRGAERVSLLQALTQLAARQQAVLDRLAADASEPEDRVRLEQSARFLGGVGALAGRTESESGPAAPSISSPTATQTPSPTPDPTSTIAPSPVPTTRPAVPTAAPAIPQATPTAELENPSPTAQPEKEQDHSPAPTEKPDGGKTDVGDSPPTGTPEHEKPETPGPQPTKED